MTTLLITNEVKLYFPNLQTENIVLTMVEEHPGNEVPNWSLQAEKESCQDNIEELIKDEGYEFDEELLSARVVKTIIYDYDSNVIVDMKEW